MSIKPPAVRKRAANKLANTTFGNELADAINTLPLEFADADAPVAGSPLVLGVTVDSGPDEEDDFICEAYWWKPLYVLEDPGGDPADFEIDGGEDSGIRTATNIAERTPGAAVATGTHLLPAGTIILAWMTVDTAGNMRWMFSRKPPELLPAIVVTYNGCDATLTVHPITAAFPGGNPAITLTLNLPVNANGHFVGANIQAGQTVYYETASDGTNLLVDPYKSFDVKYKQTTGTPEVPDCESIRFEKADFKIDAASLAPCADDSLATISWNGFAVEAYPSVLKCGTKILAFQQDGAIAHDGTQYPIEWDVTNDTEVDPCTGSATTLKRVTVKGSVWVPDAPVYTADEIWIHEAANEFSHIGPSTTATTETTVHAASVSGGTLIITPRKINYDAKGHIVSVEDDTPINVDLSSLFTTIDVVTDVGTPVCNSDGTMSLTVTKTTIKVWA